MPNTELRREARCPPTSVTHPHPQHQHLAQQRGHLRAHGLDVRLVVQALRVVGHAVAQLEQTV